MKKWDEPLFWFNAQIETVVVLQIIHTLVSNKPDSVKAIEIDPFSSKYNIIQATPSKVDWYWTMNLILTTSPQIVLIVTQWSNDSPV